MKKLLVACILASACRVAHAAPTVYIQSKNTLQSGTTIYITSGTVQNLTISNGTFGRVTTTTSTVTTMTVSSFTATAATLGSLSLTTFSISTMTPTHIIGTTTNDDATAGTYGEYISSTTTAAKNSVNGAYSNVVQMTLTAGDWDVVGQLSFALSTGTGLSVAVCVVSVNSGDTATDHVEGLNTLFPPLPISANGGSSNCTIVYRLSVSGSTIVYLKQRLDFSGGQPFARGTLRARRIR